MTKRMLVRSAVIIAMVAFAVAVPSAEEGNPGSDGKLDQFGSKERAREVAEMARQKKIYGTGDGGSLKVSLTGYLGDVLHPGRPLEMRRDFHRDGTDVVDNGVVLRAVAASDSKWWTVNAIQYKATGLWPSAQPSLVTLTSDKGRLKASFSNPPSGTSSVPQFSECRYDVSGPIAKPLCLDGGLPSVLFGELAEYVVEDPDDEGRLHADIDRDGSGNDGWEVITQFCLQPINAQNDQLCPAPGTLR